MRKGGEEIGYHSSCSGNEHPVRNHRILFLAFGTEMEKREKKREKKEAVREKQEFLMVKSIGAALSLGEATAEAVARIPDSHCNGDMHAALEYARQIKHEQKDFLTQQGIEAIF